jgi:hypothetical protein
MPIFGKVLDVLGIAITDANFDFVGSCILTNRCVTTLHDQLLTTLETEANIHEQLGI